jgi:hypothetical protein
MMAASAIQLNGYYTPNPLAHEAGSVPGDVISSGARFVEVPVNYLPQVGTSAVTGDLREALVLGSQMIGFIPGYRLKTQGKTPRRTCLSPR